MERRSITISIRFKGVLPQIETISFLESILKGWFDREISELNYTLTDRSGFNWKQKSKSLKYTPDNLKEYENILNNADEKISFDFELLKNLEEYVYKSRDIDFSIIFKQNNPISALNFVFDIFLYQGVSWKTFIKTVVNYLDKHKCAVVYGFLLCLENIKNPSLYIEGVGTYELSNKEEKKLNLWANNMNNCEAKVWDILWGNIISSKHIQFNRELLDGVKKIVGEDNFIQLNENIAWFNLKSDLSQFDILKYDNERKELYQYFKKLGSILTE